jgi:hypothetical protein
MYIADFDGPQAMLPILRQHGYLLRRLRFNQTPLVLLYFTTALHAAYMIYQLRW